MKQKISNWSNNDHVFSNLYQPYNFTEIRKILKSSKQIITMGSGFNYGDATFSKNIINLNNIKKKIQLNIKENTIECSSNFLLKELLDFAETRKLTLPILPGTANITIGGAIAADVHGKNHTSLGSFCNHILEIQIMCSNGKIIKCNKYKYKNLFKATCGGMGLTGIILSAKIKLVPLKSKTMKIRNYFFTDYNKLVSFLIKKKSDYSVTWVDFYSIKKNKIRAVFSEGNFINDQKVTINNSMKIPNFVLKLYFNLNFIKFFNSIYFYFNKLKKVYCKNYRNFLLPFDNFYNPKNFYGNHKIIQIQIIIKKQDLKKKLIDFLKLIEMCNLNCFLIGIKTFGKKNKNFLSFPEEGFTITADLVLDYKLKNEFKKFRNELFKQNFKIYLTKDILLNKKTFIKTYPNVKNFLKIKKKYDPKNKFYSSLFSRIF